MSAVNGKGAKGESIACMSWNLLEFDNLAFDFVPSCQLYLDFHLILTDLER